MVYIEQVLKSTPYYTYTFSVSQLYGMLVSRGQRKHRFFCSYLTTEAGSVRFLLLSHF